MLRLNGGHGGRQVCGMRFGVSGHGAVLSRNPLSMGCLVNRLIKRALGALWAVIIPGKELAKKSPHGEQSGKANKPKS